MAGLSKWRRDGARKAFYAFNLNDNLNDNYGWSEIEINLDANDNHSEMKYLKGLWLFCSYLFWPQWGRYKESRYDAR